MYVCMFRALPKSSIFILMQSPFKNKKNQNRFSMVSSMKGYYAASTARMNPVQQPYQAKAAIMPTKRNKIASLNGTRHQANHRYSTRSSKSQPQPVNKQNGNCNQQKQLVDQPKVRWTTITHHSTIDIRAQVLISMILHLPPPPRILDYQQKSAPAIMKWIITWLLSTNPFVPKL